MATPVLIRVPITARQPPTTPAHPKVTLVAGSRAVTFDYAGKAGELSNLAPTYVELDRADRTPLLVRSGRQLRRLAFDARLLRGNSGRSVEGALRELDRIADSGDLVELRNYGPAAAGVWRLTELGITIENRQHGTNHVTDAVAGITLTRPSDPRVSIGPLSGGSRPPVPRPPAPAARIHVVRAGDTLWQIAERYYRDPSRWPQIARRNGIRDLRRLQIGTRLIIP